MMRKLLPIVLTACVTLLTVVLPADARRNSRTVRQERQRLERQARQTGRDLEQATALAAKQLRRIERLEADIAGGTRAGGQRSADKRKSGASGQHVPHFARSH